MSASAILALGAGGAILWLTWSAMRRLARNFTAWDWMIATMIVLGLSCFVLPMIFALFALMMVTQ